MDYEYYTVEQIKDPNSDAYEKKITIFVSTDDNKKKYKFTNKKFLDMIRDDLTISSIVFCNVDAMDPKYADAIMQFAKELHDDEDIGNRHIFASTNHKTEEYNNLLENGLFADLVDNIDYLCMDDEWVDLGNTAIDQLFDPDNPPIIWNGQI